MLVTVLSADHSQSQEIEVIRLDGPLNNINYFHLFMASSVAEQIYSWAYEFQINGARYTSNQAHHDLQQEDGSQIRRVRLGQIA